MSHYKHEAKQSRHDKMKSMGIHKDHETSKHFDDTHPYDGVPLLTTDETAGLKPIGKQRFRRGGKVAHAEGKAAKHHLGKKPRSKYAGGSLQKGLVGDNPFTSTVKAAGKTQMSPTSSSVSPTTPTVTKPVTTTPPPRPSDLSQPQTMTGQEADDYMNQRKHGGRIYKAGGGLLGLDPVARKKRVAAIAMRKKKAGLPYAPPTAMGMGAGLTRKKGGSVSAHPDEAADKKLIKSMVKGAALKHREEKCWGGKTERPHKLSGGALSKYVSKAHSDNMRRAFHYDDLPANQKMDAMSKMANRSRNIERAVDKMSGMPAVGARVPAGPNMPKDEMKRGGRLHRKSGGKTTINLIVDAGQKQPRGMAPVPVGGGPAMSPQLAAALMGAGAGGPQGGVPGAGALPAAGAGPGLGAMGSMAPGRPGMSAPVPPLQGGGMMRKSGGRVGGKAPQAAMPTHQEHDYGSGSGLGRLEKRKWPLAK
jgi:hypothetical protein